MADRPINPVTNYLTEILKDLKCLFSKVGYDFLKERDVYRKGL
jgi:hypothetical protein